MSLGFSFLLVFELKPSCLCVGWWTWGGLDEGDLDHTVILRILGLQILKKFPEQWHQSWSFCRKLALGTTLLNLLVLWCIINSKVLKASPLSSVTTNQWAQLLLYLAGICFFLGESLLLYALQSPQTLTGNIALLCPKVTILGKDGTKIVTPSQKLAPGKASWI